MDSQEFIQNFADQFEETDLTRFSIDTKFRDLEEWSSLKALFIIGMVDEKYQIKIKGDDVRQSQTIGDLYEIVKNRI